MFSTVRGILSTVGGFQCGEYLEYGEGISRVPWRVFSTVEGYRDTCHDVYGGIMSTVRVFRTVELQKMIPPTVLMISPTCIMNSLMVLKISPR